MRELYNLSNSITSLPHSGVLMKSFKYADRFRTILAGGLILLLGLVSTSCVEDVGLINRTSPDKVDKLLFEGVWLYVAPRYLVVATAGGLYGFFGLYRLLDLGGIPRRPLCLRQLFVAVLFAGDFWIFAARYFWRSTGVVAGLASFFAGFPNFVGARWISFYLLLLSRCLLQGLLGRSV